MGEENKENQVSGIEFVGDEEFYLSEPLSIPLKKGCELLPALTFQTLD